jgi:hypothetical protein
MPRKRLTLVDLVEGRTFDAGNHRQGEPSTSRDRLRIPRSKPHVGMFSISAAPETRA